MRRLRCVYREREISLIIIIIRANYIPRVATASPLHVLHDGRPVIRSIVVSKLKQVFNNQQPLIVNSKNLPASVSVNQQLGLRQQSNIEPASSAGLINTICQSLQLTSAVCVIKISLIAVKCHADIEIEHFFD